MTTRHYLGVTDIAQRLGIAKQAVSAYRLPEPDVMIGRTRGWLPETIDAWNAARPGRGVGGGRPRRISEIGVALPKRMERYRDRIASCFHEDNDPGEPEWWLNFAPGWREEDSLPGRASHSVHCHTRSEMWDELANALPCDCVECRRALTSA